MNCFSQGIIARGIALRYEPTMTMMLIGGPRHAALVLIQCTSFRLDIHVLVNWHLSKQGIWPVSHDHIIGSGLELIKVTCFLKLTTSYRFGLLIGSRGVDNSRKAGKIPGCQLDFPGWETFYFCNNRNSPKPAWELIQCNSHLLKILSTSLWTIGLSQG